jgi:DNA gyrase/topoisomerase IV subunit A
MSEIKKDKRELATTLLELIESFSEFDDMTGKQKKQAVLDKMGQLFDLDLELIIIINDMIDIIIEVHKHRTKIKKKAKKILSLCC